MESYEVIRISPDPACPPPPPAPHYTAKFSTDLLINLPDSRSKKINDDAFAEVRLRKTWPCGGVGGDRLAA